MKKLPTLALIVHACDRYELLYAGFIHFFRANWGADLPFNCYFLTEEIDVNFAGFINVKTGKGEWSDRLRRGLAAIPEPYVLYLQEDMWFDKAVYVPFFVEIMDFILENDANLVKLHSSEVYKTSGLGVEIAGFQIAQLDNRTTDYLMSHQISIWKKTFFMAQLLPNEHPWRNERNATKRMKKLNPMIFQIDFFAEDGKPPLNENSQLQNRSSYHAVSANSMLYNAVEPFLEVLKSEKGPLSIYGQKLQSHYDNHFTHDGQPRARKEDIFTKFRKWLFKR